jgi:hypothetical protein
MTEQEMKVDARLTALEVLVTMLLTAEFSRMGLSKAELEAKLKDVAEGAKSIVISSVHPTESDMFADEFGQNVERLMDGVRQMLMKN